MNMFTLVWKNSLRKKSRFILTLISIAIAFFLFTSLAAVNNALNINTSASNQYRLMTNHKISMTRSLPINYQQKIAALKGVEKVTYASWFGGFFQNEKNQLAMAAVDHKSYFELFDEYQVTEQKLSQWKNTRTGLIIGQKVATEFGWKVGDKVPLSSSIWMNKEGHFNWEFTVSAIYQAEDNSVDESHIFFQHAYFDEARAYAGYMVSWLSTGIVKHADVGNVSKSIDALFANSNATTRTTTEQTFIKEQAQQFVDMTMVIKVVVVAVFFTLLLIVCNTTLQANRERLKESAMMKALGFSSATLIIHVYLEALLLLIFGALMGCLLANSLMNQISVQFADFLSGIAITPTHYIHVLVISFIAAFICSFFPAISISKLSISKTLGSMS